MLHIFDARPDVFSTWQVLRYEQEGDAYLLQVSAILRDNSRLEVRDYVFGDGSRKYAYQWMESNDALRRRWDNAPHWPDISTTPHHVHLPEERTPQLSTVTNLEDLLTYMVEWLETSHSAQTE